MYEGAGKQGRLTTHVLDMSQGKPAAGMRLWLYRLDEAGEPVLLGEARTNGDGRVGAAMLGERADGGPLMAGLYELVFDVADYFRKANGGAGVDADAFLDRVPIRFRVTDAGEDYHVPLLVAPGGYSTYRGS
ncbi:hydroxyisourate hydrolase [Paenibacillus darwinianus]|nr:hydroxyisourate hydrolase [Paenibacillus darwinianus]